MRINDRLLFYRRNTFILNFFKKIHSERKHEHTIPLYERNSRCKYKKAKLLKRFKIQISHLNKNKKDEDIDHSFLINTSINSQICYDKSLLLQSNINIENHTNNMVDDKEKDELISDDNNKDIHYTQKSQNYLNCKDEKVISNNNLRNEEIEKKKKIYIISILNDVPLSFIYFKKIYFLLLNNEKDIYDLLKYMKNKNFLKLCIFMNKKKCRSYVMEKEFLTRINHTIEYLKNESKVKENHNKTNINYINNNVCNDNNNTNNINYINNNVCNDNNNTNNINYINNNVCNDNNNTNNINYYFRTRLFTQLRYC
ncbi:hypothetical protein PFMALIP_02940 [Plasmodium falciparum MaliPS096_E11]|uniref:Uncharacterized protein n=1 Tax=Plasmodium falciparum MaliPS096_E11 TaxID=1036727 RepID=A0A024WPU9_PLAFA|nr:hypothetical protein PFMALIP_02940 [Plasmodium falciparum MaliPS096_E11]